MWHYPINTYIVMHLLGGMGKNTPYGEHVLAKYSVEFQPDDRHLLMWETRASLSIPTTPSNCHSGQLVQLNGMSFFPVSLPLPDANEQGPC